MMASQVAAATPLRLYYKCADCLRAVAVDQDGEQGERLARLPTLPTCGVCGGPMWCMGKVGSSGKTWAREVERSVCDDRCTNADGPHCECACGGRNHGSRKRVTVVVASGVVTLAAGKDDAKYAARAVEFRAARDAAWARYNAKWAGPLAIKAKEPRAWLDPAVYSGMQRDSSAIRYAAGLAVHSTRMKKLAAACQAEAGRHE